MSPIKRLAPLGVAALLLVACGDSGAGPEPPSNQAPTVLTPIPDQRLTSGGDAATLDLADHFTDPDGDQLSYTVSSSDSEVAAASASGSVVTVRPVGPGAAAVTATARDPGGRETALRFDVAVHQPDLVASVSRDSVAVAAGASFEYQVKIRNRGNGVGTAAATTVATYVSADSLIEATDERVGEPREVEALPRYVSASVAATFATDSATTTWTAVWVGACVEPVEGELETGNNCSAGIKVTTVPTVSYSFVSASGRSRVRRPATRGPW